MQQSTIGNGSVVLALDCDAEQNHNYPWNEAASCPSRYRIREVSIPYWEQYTWATCTGLSGGLVIDYDVKPRVFLSVGEALAAEHFNSSMTVDIETNQAWYELYGWIESNEPAVTIIGEEVCHDSVGSSIDSIKEWEDMFITLTYRKSAHLTLVLDYEKAPAFTQNAMCFNLGANFTYQSGAVAYIIDQHDCESQRARATGYLPSLWSFNEQQAAQGFQLVEFPLSYFASGGCFARVQAIPWFDDLETAQAQLYHLFRKSKVDPDNLGEVLEIVFPTPKDMAHLNYSITNAACLATDFHVKISEKEGDIFAGFPAPKDDHCPHYSEVNGTIIPDASVCPLYWQECINAKAP